MTRAPRNLEKDNTSRRARTARYREQGLSRNGQPLIWPDRIKPTRDHAAEVEDGLNRGLDLKGIAADMGVQPQSLVTMLVRKGRADLAARLRR